MARNDVLDAGPVTPALRATDDDGLHAEADLSLGEVVAPAAVEALVEQEGSDRGSGGLEALTPEGNGAGSTRPLRSAVKSI